MTTKVKSSVTIVVILLLVAMPVHAATDMNIYQSSLHSANISQVSEAPNHAAESIGIVAQQSKEVFGYKLAARESAGSAKRLLEITKELKQAYEAEEVPEKMRAVHENATIAFVKNNAEFRLALENETKELEKLVLNGKIDSVFLERQQKYISDFEVASARINEFVMIYETTGKLDIDELKELEQLLESPRPKRVYPTELPHRLAEPTKKEPYSGPGIVPAYNATARAGAPTGDDLADTIDANQTQEIKDLAAELDYHPVTIYEYVRNNMDYELYYGSRKGSTETLKQRGGNDFDQASLLIALYRASGIPARYVYGTIDIPIDKAMNWVGVEDEHTAGNLLATAGVPTIALISGGEIVALRIEHVWVEAYVPYTNYRGVPISESGEMWIPLDPSFKQYDYSEGLDIPAEMGFDADTFLNDYIATMHNESPIELYVQDIEDYIAANHPNLTYDDVLRTRWIEPEWLGLLPATLPYSTVTVQDEYAEIPDNLRDKIRFHIHDDYGTLLDYTARMPEIAGKRDTISYIAATPADQAVIDSYGGLYDTPPYLVDLKPVLKIAGNDTAIGTSIGMGLTHYFDICFTTWQGSDWIQNYIISGTYLAVGLDTQSVPDRFLYPEVVDNESFVGEKLYRTAMDYLDRCDHGQRIADETMQMVTVKAVSDVIASNDISVGYLFGQPQTFEWKGLLVDADRCILGPFSVIGDANKSKHYMTLTGMEGSISENRVFEDNYEVEAVSGIKALEIASDLGIQIHDINSSNIGAILPTLSLSSAVKADIQNAVNQGWVVKVPATEFAYKNWTGVGWVKMDPDTGEGGYMISGVTSGGQTVDIWLSVLMWLFTMIKEVDHIEADITHPVPPDIYFPYKRWYEFNWLNPHIYFDVTYTIYYDDGSTAVLNEKYRAHWPYPPGYYTFYAGWGTGATRDIVVFGVSVKMPDDVYAKENGDSITLEAEMVPVAPPGATYSWSAESSGEGTFTPVDSPTTEFSGTKAGKLKAKITVSKNGETWDTEKLTVFKMTLSAVGAEEIDPVGNLNIQHFVTPKGSGNAVLTATVTPVDATDYVRNHISWQGATADPGDSLKATVPKTSASKNIVKVKVDGQVCSESRVWVVWTIPSSTDIPISTVVGNVQTGDGTSGPGIGIRGGYDFTFAINPQSIISDANRPDLSGAKLSAVPGAAKTHVLYGTTLAGGADKKWDESRQIRVKILNPHLYPIAQLPQVTGHLWNGQPAVTTIPENYPANPAEGNDDTTTGDPEDNDPYNDPNKFKLTGHDRPQATMRNSTGSVGDTYEERYHFREFARLELGSTWYRISDDYPWRIHFKFKKVGTQITSGPDGIANTVAAGDDIQVIGVGKGEPNSVIIEPGLNGVLDTAPTGDDVVVGTMITAGPDGIANTVAAGDDVQVIGVGSGKPNSVIITAGPNGIIDSIAVNDDVTEGGWINDGGTKALNNNGF